MLTSRCQRLLCQRSDCIRCAQETGKGDKGEITAAKDVKSESKDRLKDGFRDKPSREKGKVPLDVTCFHC